MTVLPEGVLQAVPDILKRVAATEVMPLYRNLAAHQITDKSKDNPVTEADIAAEKAIISALHQLLPSSIAIGEESVHEDESLLRELDGDRLVWVIDPIDGTQAFTEGRDDFCLMLAAVLHGETQAAWIYQPTCDVMTSAALGQGAMRNGSPISVSKFKAPKNLRTAIYYRYLPHRHHAALEDGVEDISASNETKMSAGVEYDRLASGQTDLVVYWNAHVWDHAPGALIVKEAGGDVRFLDGEPYAPLSVEKKGLLAVGAPEFWEPLRDRLFPNGIK